MTAARWKTLLVFWPTVGLLGAALGAGVVQSLRFDSRLPRIELDYGWYLDALSARGDLDGFQRGMQVALAIDDGMDTAGGEKLLASSYSQQHNFVDAAAHYERAVDRAPQDPDARFLLGTTLLQMNRAAEAIPHLAQARTLRPDDPSARTNLGLALAQEGRLAEAITEFETLVRLQPEAARNHVFLARALQADGRVEAAQETCRNALRLAPGDPQIQRSCEEITGGP